MIKITANITGLEFCQRNAFRLRNPGRDILLSSFGLVNLPFSEYHPVDVFVFKIFICVLGIILVFGRVFEVSFDTNCKNHKISDTRKFAVITLKVEQDAFSLW